MKIITGTTFSYRIESFMVVQRIQSIDSREFDLRSVFTDINNCLNRNQTSLVNLYRYTASSIFYAKTKTKSNTRASACIAIINQYRIVLVYPYHFALFRETENGTTPVANGIKFAGTQTVEWKVHKPSDTICI